MLSLDSALRTLAASDNGKTKQLRRRNVRSDDSGDQVTESEDVPHTVARTNNSPVNQAKLLINLTEITGLLSGALYGSEKSVPEDDVIVKLKKMDLLNYISTLTKTMTVIASVNNINEPQYKTMIPPDSCEPDSLCKAAATLDSHKLRLLLSISTISMKDLNSYSQLLLAQQSEYRRKHRRSYPLNENENGVFTPSDLDSLKFVDDNSLISEIFAPILSINQYFHVLRAFTHESVTSGRTSSKLLSMIGKYALKTETFRLSYNNGESYDYAKQNVLNFLDEDTLYEIALKANISELIVLGTEHYNLDKEVVLQTLYALFGVAYFVLGKEGLHYLNDYFKWKNHTARSW